MPSNDSSDDLKFLWVMFKAVQSMKSSLKLVCPEQYYLNIDEMVAAIKSSPPSLYDYLKSYDLSQALIDQLPKASICWPPGNHRSDPLLWSNRVKNEIPDVIDAICGELDGWGAGDALMTWSNCASLTAASRYLNIPIIHNEVGPLRPPHYKATAYFDFIGVNRSTSALDRWMQFRRCNYNVVQYSNEEIISILSSYSCVPSKYPFYPTGIALQDIEQERLSGVSNEALIEWTKERLEGPYLLRHHPSHQSVMRDPRFAYDDSSSAAEFVGRINTLVTVDSGIGFEAILLGKRVYALGDPPYKPGTYDQNDRPCIQSKDELRTWINWFVFGYLMPFDCLFKPEYYKWRLTQPSELEIYSFNQEYWHSCSGREI